MSRRSEESFEERATAYARRPKRVVLDPFSVPYARRAAAQARNPQPQPKPDTDDKETEHDPQ